MDYMHKIVSLAVVELPTNHKVRCQAPECLKPIWKAVHVVRIEGTLQVLGSSCFKKLNHDLPPGVGLYTGSSVRKLTEEERQLLIANTETLIQKLEQEFQEAASPLQADVVERQIAADIQPPVAKRTGGPPRTVKCFYCKHPMVTELTHTPGMGFKCATCKKNKVPPPPRPGTPRRVPTRPISTPKAAKQLAKEKTAEDYRKAKGKE
ncbi:hypothetical protein [Marinimicrobium sp. ABcell2]|uniref:hypothetical protein n=1 Tax=Marinimicrobium sp. ABcell2 TaxID=3069751 RepID=UPI0027AEF2FF|nr:hypothetical protein [Marinimicrobium sp. ABcell2]MDQ2077564.1 hypothetical protein [Marinimicrobium sp. ABcell2]